MKIYDTFQQFWNDFSTEKPNDHGFNDWAIVRFTHVNDAEYAKQKIEETDELGFQPLWLTMANPITKSTKQILIKDVQDKLAADFLKYRNDQFVGQLGARFGSFRPDEFQAFAEYDSWESFYSNWLERDGKAVIGHNMPLLFDHTPKVEYWTRKQSGLDVLEYQRLLVTTFFVPKNQFYDFFIKDVNDAEMQRIKLLSMSRIGLNLNSAYTVEAPI